MASPYTRIFTSSVLSGIAFNTAYTDVTLDSSPTVLPGGKYKFEGYFNYSVSASTTGIFAALNGPSLSFLAGEFKHQISTSAAAPQHIEMHSGFRPSFSSTGTNATTGQTLAITFSGLLIIGSTGGALAVSFKGNTTTGTAGNSTVAAGGRLILEEVA
jgi:hypothetical protein